MTPASSWLAFLLVAVAFGAPVERPYPRVPIGDMPTTVHTHVCTTGLVTEIHKEADGDTHLRVEDPATPEAFVVAEIIPTLKPTEKNAIRIPKKSHWVEVCGITRYDKKHRWWEIHPVERLR